MDIISAGVIRVSIASTPSTIDHMYISNPLFSPAISKHVATQHAYVLRCLFDEAPKFYLCEEVGRTAPTMTGNYILNDSSVVLAFDVFACWPECSELTTTSSCRLVKVDIVADLLECMGVEEDTA